MNLQIDNVTNRQDVLNRIKQKSYDLMLVDCQLPGITNLVKEIKRSRIPFVVLVRRANKNIAVKMMKLGAASYIIVDKPFVDFAPHIVKNALEVDKTAKESEKKYFDLIQNLPVGVYKATVEGKGRYVMANPAMANMLGYGSEEELCKFPVSNMYDTPSERRVRADELIEKKRFKRKEIYLKRKDGSHFWGAVTAKAVPETGEVQYFDGIIEDITAFKNLIEGLHKAVAAADELLNCPNLDSLYRRAIEIAREKLNIERCGLYVKIGDKWQGTFSINLDRITTDERAAYLENPKFIQSFLKAIKKKRESLHWKELPDLMLQEWDQRPRKYIPIGRGWLVMTVIRKPPSQNIVGIFFNDTAISGKPIDTTQQEIIAVYCSLLGSLIAVKGSEEELQNKHIKLDTELKNLKNFYKVFLHEIRSPMSVFNTSALRVMTLLEKLPIEEQAKLPLKKKINDIYAIGERLSFIAATYYFDELIKPRILESIFILKDIVTPVLNMTTDYIHMQYGIETLTEDTSLVEQEIYGDKNLLGMVFNILITNAAKYTPNTRMPIKISGHLDKDGRYFNLDVSNYGLRIYEDEKESIFSNGVKGKEAILYKLQGTGMGLYLSRSIMRNLHGDLILKSLFNPVIFTMKIPTIKWEYVKGDKNV